MATPEGWVTKEVIEFYRPFAKGGAEIVTVGDSAVISVWRLQVDRKCIFSGSCRL